jgi:phosphomannomutase
MLIRSISGVRGLTEIDLTREIIHNYLSAAHSVLNNGVIYIGRDSRGSGEDLLEIAVEEFQSLGRNIVVCGIVPTPTIQYSVQESEAVGGVIITASHNPEEWNGFKFVREDGTFFHPKECKRLFNLADKKTPKKKKIEIPGIVWQDFNSIQKHVYATMELSAVNTSGLRERNFRVAVDAVNGAAAVALPLLLESLGCDVIRVNCEPTGNFTRGTEPLPEHLSVLCQTVIENQADIGLAVDPDGDRLAVVDEKGHPLGEEYTLVLAVDGYLARTGDKQPVITNLSTTQALDHVAVKHSVDVKRTPVGEINVVREMQRLGSNIGGEGNGGVILKESHLGRDALVGAALVLNRLTGTTEPLSEIVSTLPQFIIIKDKIQLDKLNAESVLKHAKKIFSDSEMDEQDGLKCIWDDRWIHLRRSNTEPILRIYAEAPDRSSAEKLIGTLKTGYLA